MTIQPLALRIERFGSFVKEQVFNFPHKPGLYLMVGKNEVEPRLGGNAAGKSTIWKALTWLVHGKTPEGLKAGDVCSWDAKDGTTVAFVFMNEKGEPCCCKRTWKPNTWTLEVCEAGETDLSKPLTKVDLAKDPENALLTELRMTFDTWLCTVVMAQGEDYFLDMERGKQASLFGSVMALDEWEVRADRASAAATAEDKRLRELEREASHLNGRLAATNAHGIERMADDWDEKHKHRLQGLKMDHNNLCDRRKRLKNALDQATRDEERVRDRTASLKRNEALEAEYDLVCANVRKQEDALLKLDVETKALRNHAAHLEKSTECPLCKRPYDTKDWQQEVKRAERVLSAAVAEAKNIQHVLDIARSRREVLEAEIDKQEDAGERARMDLHDAEADTRRARNDLLMCDKQLDAIEDVYEDAEREINPFREAIEKAKREARNLRAELARMQEYIDDSEMQHAIKSMWVRGFKEIRLREIAAALAELEVEVNSAVMALGLEDWELRFDVDRETKTKTVQRGFTVSVLGPGTDKPVPWAAWSGGEKQRLRVAGNAGLSDMVRTRTGCAFPLEVWDEPTNGLSPEGKQDLFEYLAERARIEERVIMLVDHQAHDFGGFAGVCTIVKTPSGSRIRTSW